LVATQRDWVDTIETAVRIAKDEGHFRDDVDPAQFAHEMYGIFLGFHLFHRLLREGEAEGRSKAAFAALLERSR
jgi:hypothetical protein